MFQRSGVKNFESVAPKRILNFRPLNMLDETLKLRLIQNLPSVDISQLINLILLHKNLKLESERWSSIHFQFTLGDSELLK